MTAPKRVECSTQAELDAAVADGNTAVVRAGSFEAYGEATVWAFGEATVTAYGKATVTASDEATGNAKVDDRRDEVTA